MTTKVRPFKGRKKEWEVDIRFEWPDGDIYRERLRAPVTSKSGAQRWGEQRESHLLAQGKEALKKNAEALAAGKIVPTVEEFVPRYIQEHCVADRLKPSSTHSTKQTLRRSVVPLIGNKRLNEVTNTDIQRIKAEMAHLSPKTVNNTLSPLSMMLKKAVEWGVIDVMPCTVKLLKVAHDEAPFYDFDDYERIVEAARAFDARLHVAVLLGGDAGLRMGEVIALEWVRVNFVRGVLVVAQSEWRDQVTLPKGGRMREVKLTVRLLKALKDLRHLRGGRVLLLDDGSSFNRETFRKWGMRAERKAGLAPTGRFHIYRHTFCAHLAMKGAPAMAIKELAGHSDLTTTMRYMHLSPAARDSAIGLLDAVHAGSKPPTGTAKTASGFGDIMETEK